MKEPNNSQRNKVFGALTALSLCLFSSFSGIANAGTFDTVVIDAGHGGKDIGGNYGKVYEKHLALDTSFRLENELKNRGYRTVMTRRSDQFISLGRRSQIGNSYPNSIFVSIHYNFTWKKHVRGIETFYYSARSKALSDYVQAGMLKRSSAGDRGSKFARYYVIRHTNTPSILVECGFVSNASERSKMKKAWFRDAVSKGIADGIDKYKRTAY